MFRSLIFDNPTTCYLSYFVKYIMIYVLKYDIACIINCSLEYTVTYISSAKRPALSAKILSSKRKLWIVLEVCSDNARK